MDGPDVDALEAEVGELVALVQGLAPEDWSRPTRCPGWTVAELVAHCEGMLVRLVGANAEAVDAPAEVDRVGYYRYDPNGRRDGEDASKTFSEVIRDRVIDEVAGRTGPELRASLEVAAAEAMQGIRVLPGDRVIKRSGHPRMTFDEFVASRNLEFGVHAMDIADAVGREQRVHPEAASIIVPMLDGLLGAALPAGVGWDASTYILKGTGRLELEDDECSELGALADRFPLLA